MINSAHDSEFDSQAYLGAGLEEASSKETSLESEFQRIVSRQQSRPFATKQQTWSNHPLKAIWARTGQYLVDFLTGQQSLSIRQQTTTTGELQWIIYDPVTQTRLSFSSEQAVRVWLEERSAS
ncbi:hypothetical protein [cf. Phormidesmis sp. LEGE 11477]|uniref:hypothetical protein n=1 Tax=cf. Phormidesmis sp. LEGE 11477 TaxID=1828680 RepID=UPI00188299AC|nr:hypothetical protein [cf. Phormidesmis sp. LEGE 11477]MBE9061907.1 hypothetical protein [cf. Phormidesmis sp. LEGE 11477]